MPQKLAATTLADSAPRRVSSRVRRRPSRPGDNVQDPSTPPSTYEIPSAVVDFVTTTLEDHRSEVAG